MYSLLLNKTEIINFGSKRTKGLGIFFNAALVWDKSNPYPIKILDDDETWEGGQQSKQKSMHKRFLCATVPNNGDRRGVRLFLFILIAINLSIHAESFSSVVDYFSSGPGRGRGRGQDDWSCGGADADGASATTDSATARHYTPLGNIEMPCLL